MSRIGGVIAAVLVPPVVTACASAEPRQDDLAAPLAATYKQCLRTSYASHRQRTEPNTAAEMAFQSCQTEENAFQAYFISVRNMEPRNMVVASAAIRARLKAELIAGSP